MRVSPKLNHRTKHRSNIQFLPCISALFLNFQTSCFFWKKYPIWILILPIYYIWETSRNKLKRHLFQLDLFSKIVLTFQCTNFKSFSQLPEHFFFSQKVRTILGSKYHSYLTFFSFNITEFWLLEKTHLWIQPSKRKLSSTVASCSVCTVAKVIHSKYYKYLKKGAHKSHLGRRKICWFLAD